MARLPTEVVRGSEVAETGPVDHGVADLDAGGPPVEDDPADLALEDGSRAGVVLVALRELHGRGQAALEPLRRGHRTGNVVIAHHERHRSKTSSWSAGVRSNTSAVVDASTGAGALRPAPAVPWPPRSRRR